MKYAVYFIKSNERVIRIRIYIYCERFRRRHRHHSVQPLLGDLFSCA